MAQPHEIARVGKLAQQELMGSVPKLAKGLFGTPGPDSTKLSAADYTSLVQRNWADSGFKQQQAMQNPSAFLHAAKQLGATVPGAPSLGGLKGGPNAAPNLGPSSSPASAPNLGPAALTVPRGAAPNLGSGAAGAGSAVPPLGSLDGSRF